MTSMKITKNLLCIFAKFHYSLETGYGVFRFYFSSIRVFRFGQILVQMELDGFGIRSAVINATFRRFSVPTSSARFLVVRGRIPWDTPVDNKPTKNREISIRYKFSYLPDRSLIYSHSETDGGSDNGNLSVLPFILHFHPLVVLQACVIGQAADFHFVQLFRNEFGLFSGSAVNEAARFIFRL